MNRGGHRGHDTPIQEARCDRETARSFRISYLDEAWQHDLGDDGIVDTSLLSPGLIVVATVLRHDEVQRRKDVQALAAPADAADPAFQTLWLSSGRSAEIPVIAVAAAIRERDRRGQ